MAKRLNYTIGVTADTSKLEASLQTAYTSLQKISSLKVNMPITSDLKEASLAAQQLQHYLENATNVNTGKLDLSKFSASLQASGVSLTAYASKLQAIGPEGEKAFMAVASAVAKAEVPIARSSQLLNSLWITMKNTMRWQLTSSALHGFVGALETAYGYTKDLNRSLTDIRIVTGKSADDMAVFAEQANKAAQALSTTTTDYTDASLIYYQQGLTDQEVLDRTETTIKMANVAGTTAETASQQLTAIWNNFYDGSKSLEYYADVMVKLGAATASSSDEISEGIEKFAAVANTVGLSYDYAASALATVTAQTRESASVVGTAFRTLFSRIQGLQQGETLDDGTTLNKYSEALAKVGVDIKDTNGNLKDMDEILNELGGRWNTLAQDQKIALAETVAGVRQWTQLIALMDNWDFFQKNLALAQGSEGTLEEQANIYASSWEAARDRTKAAAEDIYDSLINPDFFISLDNSMTPVLSGIADVIDAMGGMKGLILATGRTFTAVYHDQITKGLQDIAYNFTVMIGKADVAQRKIKEDFGRAALNMATDSSRSTDAEIAEKTIQAQDIEMQNFLNSQAKQMTEEQVKQLSGYKDIITAIREMALEYEKVAEAHTEETQRLSEEIIAQEGIARNSKEYKNTLESVKNTLKGIKIPDLSFKKNDRSIQSMIKAYSKLSSSVSGLSRLQAQMRALSDEDLKNTNILETLKARYKELTGIDLGNSTLQESQTEIQKTIDIIDQALEKLYATLEHNHIPVDDIERLRTAAQGAGEAEQNAAHATEISANAYADYRLKVYQATVQQETWADKVVNSANQLMQLGMMIQAIQNLGSIWNDDDLTTGEKVIQTLTNIGMIIPQVVSLISSATKARVSYNTVVLKGTEAQTAEAVAALNVGRSKVVETTQVNGNTVAVVKNTAAWYANPLTWILAGITAIVAAFTIYNTVLEENTKRRRENAQADADAAIKAAEENREESESIQTLYKDYISLRSANDRSTEGKESLRKKTKELCDALGIESTALDLLNDKYDVLNKKIAEANKQAAERGLEDSTKAVKAQQNAILENNSNYDSYLANQEGYEKLSYKIDFGGGAIGSDESEIKDYLTQALDGLDLIVNTSADAGMQIHVQNAEELLEVYERLNTAKQEISSNDEFDGIRQDSEVYSALSNWLTEIAPEYEKLAQLRQDQINYAQQLAEAEAALANQDLADVTTMEEYNQIKANYIQTLKSIFEEQDLIPDDVEDVDQYFEQLAGAYLSGYENLEKLENESQIFESIIEKIGEGNREYLQSLIDQGYDINILGRINWELVTSDGGSLEDKVELAYQAAKAKLDAENFETTIPVVTSVLTQLSNGEEPTNDEELATIKALEEEYPRLGEIRDRTSAQYIQALRDIREGMENAISTQKMAELNEAWDELKYKVEDAGKVVTNTRDELIKLYGENADISLYLDADDKDFAETMDKIMDADYSVQVAIEADLESDINDVISHTQAIEEATSLIQDGFTVAYDDVETLSKAFPGILAGYTTTKDGMIQLNSEIAQSAIGLAQTQIASEKEAAKQNILDYQKVLLAKAAAMRTIAEGLQSLTETSEDNADAQAKIEQGVTDYKSACADEQNLISSGLAESEMGDSDQVMGANENAAGTSANNWADAYDSMAKNSADWARIAIANANKVAQAMKGAQEGKVVTPEVSTGGIFSSYGGGFEASEYQNTYESRGTDNVSWSDYYEQGDYQSAYEAAIKQAESYERSAAELTNYLAKLDGTEANIANLVKNAGKGTKSGGSNKNKTYDKEDLKTLEDVEDRYHEINRQIERQEDLLDDLSNTTDRAWGTDALNGYENEIKALEKQQELYNEKLEEAQGYLTQDSALVKKYFADAQIGANGEITNYEDLLRENLNLYNAAVERYNLAVTGKTLSDEEYTALKNQLDTEKALFEARQKALEQYENTLDVVRDTTDKIQENARSIADEKLEEIKLKMEIVLDVKSMKDAVRDLSKEIAEMFGDALTHGLESAKLSAEAAQAEAALLPSYQEEWNSLKALYESTTDDADRRAIMDEIQSLQGNIVDSAKAIAEWANSIEDIVPDAVDAASERFAAFTDQLEHNTSVLDTIKELYALQGVTYKDDKGFNRLQKNSQEKLNAQLASAQLQKGWYDETAKRLEEAQARLDSLNGDETDLRYDTYKKARDAYLEEFNEAQEAYLSKAQETMETAKEMYTLEIEKAIYSFQQVLAGTNVNLDLLQDKYDHYIETEGQYFDKVNEAYQVSAWYNKLQKDIDNTTNSAYKERLKALQEEIDSRKEGNKLSQYDLDILNAKYQVLQAQMALEDAQNAKNKIQLVRDSQGNWNYQYTADQDQIADAQQNLLDAQNDWYNIAKDRTKEVAGEIVSMWKDCTDEIEQLYKDLADGNITEEEYLAKKQQIEEYYTERAKYLEEQKTKAITDMNEAGYESLKEIAEKNGETVEDFENVYANELNSMTESNKNFADYLDKYLQQCDDKFNGYQDTVEEVANKTGTDLDSLAQETDKVSTATEKLIEKGLEAKDALWDMVDGADAAATKYSDMAISIWDAVKALEILASKQANFAASQGGSRNSGSENGYDPNTDYSGVIMDGIANGWLDYNSDQYKELVKQRESKIDDLITAGRDESYWVSRGDAADERFKNSSSAGQYDDLETWKKKMHDLGVPGFATGGYTGIFDDEKLAFLHQKELVLNQTDTENILAAVRTVRDFSSDFFSSIEKALDSNAIAAMTLMGQKLNPIVTTPVQDSIEQTVHIDKVEFPNVTSRTEIEEAFVSLTNDAAQWARRKS